jgi:hypothetical protein
MIVLYSIVALYILWMGYVFTMHIRAQWDTLHWSAKLLGGPPAMFSYFLDVVINLTLASVLFFDLPREATLTQRLHRYRTGWRNRVARFVCERLLNPFDANHC